MMPTDSILYRPSLSTPEHRHLEQRILDMLGEVPGLPTSVAGMQTCLTENRIVPTPGEYRYTRVQVENACERLAAAGLIQFGVRGWFMPESMPTR